MKIKVTILAIILLIGFLSGSYAQDHIYIPSYGNVYMHTDAQLGIFGDIYNDASGGLNHNGGGTLYLYRDSNTGTGSSKIMDGPSPNTPSGNYNTGGAYIRVYDLVTDNITGANTPSGSFANTTSGSGQIEVYQELKITGNHDFVNGMVWTPRASWQHAYINYEDSATYSGIAHHNKAGRHIDGYAAYTGDKDFMFPIGDGLKMRMAGVKNPEYGEYKGAYFHADPQASVSGISGTTTGNNIFSSTILDVGNSEYWDIDGNAETLIVLTSDNKNYHTSNWGQDFATYSLGNSTEMTIAAWDGWEDLGQDIQPLTFNQDGFYSTTRSIIPDSSGNQGNAFAAFTWAMANSTSLGAKNISLRIVEVNCNPLLNFVIENEENTDYAEIMRKEHGGIDFEKIGEVKLLENTQGMTTYTFEDETAETQKEYIYKIGVFDQDGQSAYSESRIFTILCNGNIVWKIYPNPTRGNINIESNFTEKVASVRIFDAIGKVVKEIPLDHNQTVGYFTQNIDLLGVSTGLYHLAIFGTKGETLQTFKLNIID